jgi:predicted alpha/beta superfamily hydrolase
MNCARVALFLLLLGPASAAAATPVPVPLSEQFTLKSATLGRRYDILVRLPPRYDAPENAQRRYPVVYFNDAPYSFPLITGVAHLPMGQGTIEDLILVGIGYAHGTTGASSRALDYTPTRNPSSAKATGGAPGYLRFLEREMLPAVEQRYRADPARRALAGHSYGGLFGSYVLLTQPSLFRYYILSSPSFWFHKNAMWKIERAYAATHRDLAASVYMGIGSLEAPPGGSPYEMVKDVQTFDAALRSHRYPSLKLRTKVFKGATHETVVPSVMLNGLLWHFATDRTKPYDY